MKNFIIAALITVFPFAASSQDLTCADFGQLAENIMTARQNGVPLSQLMELLGELRSIELFEKLVMEAYEQPRYSTKAVQNSTIEDYRNLWELGCYSSDYGKQ